jgi:hypothetical protein
MVYTDISTIVSRSETAPCIASPEDPYLLPLLQAAPDGPLFFQGESQNCYSVRTLTVDSTGRVWQFAKAPRDS